MNILVTGGAGYIGSAAVKALVSKGHDVIALDNLAKGDKKLVHEKASFRHIDLTDKEALEKVFSENKINAVMHFAAYKAVGESMEDAVKYSDNITGTTNLLNMMIKHSVPKIIYSSSACVYGNPDKLPVDESHPVKAPINYYGHTKIMGEESIRWYAQIHGINYISLRYFNVAGDAGLSYVDPDAQNVMPILMEAVFGKRDKFTLFGDDYDTEDGTCIRDYIDVNDLVDAHVKALDLEGDHIINLGTSSGVSVKQLVDMTKEVTGKDFVVETAGKRDGDPAAVVASNEKAKELLGWEPKVSIKDMIRTTYDAYKNRENRQD